MGEAPVSSDSPKRAAARHALGLVKAGMRLGLGTGTTAREFVALLGERVAGGLRIVGVPTSEGTRRQAADLAIPLTTLDETPELDLAVDGADEVDDRLDLVKGGGGALLREKIVAAAARRFVIVVDASKRVARLGRFGLPVEIDRFGSLATRRHIATAAARHGCEGPLVLRQGADRAPFVTDGGHWIVDCQFGSIADAPALALALAAIPGVVGHGLFIGMASLVVVAGPDGVEVLARGRPAPSGASGS